MRGHCFSFCLAQLLLFLALLVACAGTAPEVPRAVDGTLDPVLVRGREVWSQACASCHGSDGSGGRGPSLLSVVDRYPSSLEQVRLVSSGRGSMPGFGSRYSMEELDAVVRYTREVL
ncbi:MAG: cytochrome c [Acidimicrobiales bacterium]|nr:cytochrome c [Acidimicrobiales bacterium]